MKTLLIWVGAIGGVLAGIGGLVACYYAKQTYQSSQDAIAEARNAEAFDLKISKTPAIQSLAADLKKVNERLGTIDKSLSSLEGWKEGIKGDIRKVAKNQETLTTDKESLQRQVAGLSGIVRTIDPARVVAAIIADVESSEERRTLIPASRLHDYKNAVRFVPPATARYWQTVAAIINYQSRLNQLAGLAPDPRQIARPCEITNGGNFRDNLFTGPTTFSKCIVDLASLNSNRFSDLILTDCVVNYSGGPIPVARSIRLVNCWFFLDFKDSTRPDPRLMVALLNSVNQTSVIVPPG